MPSISLHLRSWNQLLFGLFILTNNVDHHNYVKPQNFNNAAASNGVKET